MRSFAFVGQARKWGSLPGGSVLARRMGQIFSGSVAALLLLTLTGCAPQLPEKSSIASGSSPESSTSPASAPATVPHDLQVSAATKTARPLDLAVEAARRFCRPRLPESRWIAELDPLLTLEAASVYATVDPARVQCSMIELPARADEGDGFTQVVTVRTDRSHYRVVLVRSSLSAPWRVFRIAPSGEK